MTATVHARGACICPSQAASKIEIGYSYRRVPPPSPPPIFIYLFSISSLSTNKPSRARNPTQLLLLSLLSIITHNMMPTNKPDAEADLHLPPGFRFHPTDEELVVHYLCRKVSYQCLPVPIIAEVDLYKYDPWQLPDKALFGQKEWYFFTPRDRKYPNGQRPNRMAGTGYWKATGADKPIRPTGCGKHIGIKKALVFYAGKAPQGLKTNWIMHEYRLASSNHPATKKGSLRLDEWVLCRIYNKKNICEKPAPQMQQVSSSSVAETMDSPAIDSAELESFGTQESDIENNEFSELGDLGRPAIHQPQQSSDRMVKTETDMMSSWWPSGESLKEGKDWFMDLGSLEDLPNPPSLAFGEMDGTLDLMMFPDYYASGLFSPLSKPYQAGDL